MVENELATEPVATHGVSTRRRVITWLAVPVLAVLIAVTVRVTVVEAYHIPSSSMEPTLQVNDRILVQKRLFDLNGIGVGDLVVFDAPAQVARTGSTELIKRVVATAGDVIEAHDGQVWINGEASVEPYAVGATSDFDPVQLAPDELFVMGDNRLNSADSRIFGPIDQTTVTGSAFLGVWPITRVHPLD